MALNPTSLEIAKTSSKGKTPVSASKKTLAADKDAFKQLLAHQKKQLKTPLLADPKIDKHKKDALPIALAKAQEKKTSKNPDPNHTTPLAHLLEGKMPKVPPLPDKTSKSPHTPQKSKTPKTDLLADKKRLQTR
ncbi:hypothetical protein [Helicobacter labacensis]|uniref:hypothetical protein n=1 Tax=Helicobacter labacensis TaxID=2316079 RepID=UPI000EB00955|nr:hypothetical protein [Helicobacter labacensis]